MAERTPIVPSETRILYVDDTDSQRYAVSRMMTSAGFNVIEAASGEEALNLVVKAKPHAIVLDVRLPGISGLDVSRHLKSDENTARIPILLISAEFTSSENRAKALETGAEGYLTTPFNALELAATLKALLRTSLALQEAEQQYRNMRSLFENAMDAIVIWNHDGRFVDVNAAACHLFGLSKDELLGSRVEDYIISSSMAADTIASMRPAAGIEATKGEFQLNRGEELRIVEYTATVDFRPGLHLSIMRDISERRKAEQEIREFNEVLEKRVQERTQQLQEINRELEAFSYSVSHDLRAPFRHIAGFAELLGKRVALDAQALHYVEVIGDAARQAGRLVDDLLGFSRMGRAELRSRRVSLDGLVTEILHEFEPELEGRNVEWRVGRLGIVQADGDMLRIALRNLLHNAVKYSRSREVAVIEIGTELRGGDVVLFVRDNGVGFDMKYVGKLFGVFQRLHGVNEFEGTGIGLATVKRIVERHGGRAWAEGTVAEGATFYILLPGFEVNDRNARELRNESASMEFRETLDGGPKANIVS